MKPPPSQNLEEKNYLHIIYSELLLILITQEQWYWIHFSLHPTVPCSLSDLHCPFVTYQGEYDSCNTGLDMYKLKLSKLAVRNIYWVTANNAVFKAKRLPIEEKVTT